MKFVINNGPILKSMNNTTKIWLNLLISLIPIIIYKTIITNYYIFFIYLIIAIINIFIDIIIDFIIKNKTYKFNITDYLLQIILLFITYLFLPNIDSTNIVYIGIINQVVLTVNKFIKNINPISLFLIIYYIILNNSININFNIYILGSLITLISMYLIFTKSIKFRVLLTFIFVGIVSLLFIELNIPLLLILGSFVITYIYSTPTHAFTQYLFGLLLGIIFIFLGIRITIISIFLLSFLVKYINLYFGIYLAKKKSV